MCIWMQPKTLFYVPNCCENSSKTRIKLVHPAHPTTTSTGTYLGLREPYLQACPVLCGPYLFWRTRRASEDLAVVPVVVSIISTLFQKCSSSVVLPWCNWKGWMDSRYSKIMHVWYQTQFSALTACHQPRHISVVVITWVLQERRQRLKMTLVELL